MYIISFILYHYIIKIYSLFNFGTFRNLLKKLASVSIDDLKYVGEKYFSRLFDPKKASVALCCHPTKVDEIVDDFKG